MGFLKEKLGQTGGKPALVASGILTAVFNTIALLLIARNMGPEILGSLAFLLSFVGLLFFLGDMGTNIAYGNLLSRGFRSGELMPTFINIKLRNSILMAIISGILIATYLYLLQPEGHTAIHPISMFIMLGYFIVMNISQIWVVALAAKGREMQSKSFDLIDGLVKVVMVGGIIMLSLPNGDQEAVFYLAMIYLMAGTMAMMLIRNTARRFKKGKANDEVLVEFHEASKPLVPFVAFTALILTADKVLLWLFTEPHQAFETLGIFFGAQRITIFIAASSVSIQSLLGSALDQYISNDDVDSISGTLRMTERYVSLVVLPVATFYILFSSNLLNAFLGQQFQDAGTAVALLAGAGFFTALASPHMAYLLKASKIREMTGVSALAFIVLVSLQIVLLSGILGIDMEGIDATAISILASSIALYSASRFIIYKDLDCPPHRRMLSHLFCAALMAVVINFLIWYFEINMELKWILFFALVGTFIYGLGLYLSGEMLREDFDEFKKLTSSD